MRVLSVNMKPILGSLSDSPKFLEIRCFKRGHSIMSSPTSDLLICGGGIAGKACALALAQIGLQVTLLGARLAAALPTQGYAQRLYALNAASRQLLEELRVSFFAQTLGTPYPISDKRVSQAIQAVKI